MRWLILFISAFLVADQCLWLEGFVNREKTKEAFENLSDTKEACMYVNSAGGDFYDVLRFCQKMLEWKQKNGAQLTVFINEQATGASALLPFLADTRVVSPDAVWGDIPLGSDKTISKKAMVAAVDAMLDDLPNARVYEQVARSMIDPYAQIAGVSSKSKRLLLTVDEMKAVGVVDKVEPKEVFLTDHHFRNDQPEASGLVQGVSSKKTLEKSMRETIKFGEDPLVGYLSIGMEQPISQSTVIQVQFALDYFVKRKASCIVLHLNTPGGEVFSALKIAEMLQKVDIVNKIPVIAYVDNWAVSAGALLAYSCRYIVNTETAIMGAAEPIIQSGEAPKPASEKINSALRAEFANTASFWKRNPNIAEAMVDKDIILVVRNYELVRLEHEKQIKESDRIISRKGKLLTLRAQEMYELAVSNAILSREASAGDEVANVEEWPADKSPVFSLPYLKEQTHATMIAHNDWRISFFSFLTHPAVASLLFLGLLVGFYLEFNTPGFGLFGSIGLVCLFFILLTSFALHAVSLLEIIIIIVGLGLLAVELFFIPGFGWAGISGIVLTLGGLILLMLPSVGSLDPLQFDSFLLIINAMMDRLLWIFGGIVVGIALIIVLAKFFSHRILNLSKLVLRGEMLSSEGFTAHGHIDLPDEGTMGESYSALRPSGKVKIGNHVYEAVSETGFIDAGKPISVRKKAGNRVVVREEKEGL